MWTNRNANGIWEIYRYAKSTFPPKNNIFDGYVDITVN